MDFNTVMSLMGLLSNAEGATDPNATVPDRAVAAASGVGTALTVGGTALTAGSGVTSAGLGACSMGSVGSIAAGGGAIGAGSAALAAGGVLGAGALGYGFGTAADKLGGRMMGGTREVAGRGLGGGTSHVADDRRVSERMSDSMHTETGDRMALAIAPYLPVWLGGG